MRFGFSATVLKRHPFVSFRIVPFRLGEVCDCAAFHSIPLSDSLKASHLNPCYHPPPPYTHESYTATRHSPFRLLLLYPIHS